jgi:glucan phosphoethanolaminetransferase (alkaline phosphatase superfamily)
MVLVLHFPLLFGGFFPLFGRAVLGLPGVLLIDLTIVTAVILTWGIAQRRRWAWWCAIVFLGLMTVSSTVTFLAIPPQQIVAWMPFAPLEAGALSGVPMQGYHLALLVGAIPAATLVAVAISGRGLRVPGVRTQDD